MCKIEVLISMYPLYLPKFDENGRIETNHRKSLGQ